MPSLKCDSCGTEYAEAYGNFYTDPRSKRGWMTSCFDCVDGAREKWESNDESSTSGE